MFTIPSKTCLWHTMDAWQFVSFHAEYPPLIPTIPRYDTHKWPWIPIPTIIVYQLSSHKTWVLYGYTWVMGYPNKAINEPLGGAIISSIAAASIWTCGLLVAITWVIEGRVVKSCTKSSSCVTVIWNGPASMYRMFGYLMQYSTLGGPDNRLRPQTGERSLLVVHQLLLISCCVSYHIASLSTYYIGLTAECNRSYTPFFFACMHFVLRMHLTRPN